MKLWNISHAIQLVQFNVRYRPRFFDQVGHQPTFSFIGNKHFLTKSCHHQTYQNYDRPPQILQKLNFQSHFSPSKINWIFLNFWPRSWAVLGTGFFSQSTFLRWVFLYFWISDMRYDFLYDAINYDAIIFCIRYTIMSILVCSCLFLSVPVCSCLFEFLFSFFLNSYMRYEFMFAPKFPTWDMNFFIM